MIPTPVLSDSPYASASGSPRARKNSCTAGARGAAPESTIDTASRPSGRAAGRRSPSGPSPPRRAAGRGPARRRAAARSARARRPAHAGCPRRPGRRWRRAWRPAPSASAPRSAACPQPRRVHLRDRPGDVVGVLDRRHRPAERQVRVVGEESVGDVGLGEVGDQGALVGDAVALLGRPQREVDVGVGEARRTWGCRWCRRCRSGPPGPRGAPRARRPRGRSRPAARAAGPRCGPDSARRSPEPGPRRARPRDAARRRPGARPARAAPAR